MHAGPLPGWGEARERIDAFSVVSHSMSQEGWDMYKEQAYVGSQFWRSKVKRSHLVTAFG
jgi:hypothetical protein